MLLSRVDPITEVPQNRVEQMHCVNASKEQCESWVRIVTIIIFWIGVHNQSCVQNTHVRFLGGLVQRFLGRHLQATQCTK